MATLYKAHGGKFEVFPMDGKEFTLEEIQAYIGGYFEPMYLNEPDKEKYVMLLNEERQEKQYPVNYGATTFLVQYFNRANVTFLIGDILLVKPYEIS